jgi:hypothetical protein
VRWLIIACWVSCGAAPRPPAPDEPARSPILEWVQAEAAPPPEGWIVERAAVDRALRIPAEHLLEGWSADGERFAHYYELGWDPSIPAENVVETLRERGFEPVEIQAFPPDGVIAAGETHASVAFRYDHATGERAARHFRESLPGVELFRDLLAMLPPPFETRYSSYANDDRGFDLLFEVPAVPPELDAWITEHGLERGVNEWVLERDGMRWQVAHYDQGDHVRLALHAYVVLAPESEEESDEARWDEE